MNGLFQSLYFRCVKRDILFVGKFCVLIHDLLTIEVIKVEYKVTDFLFILLSIKGQLIDKLRGELADLGEKGIRSFGLVIIYAALLVKLQLFLHFLLFLCWNVAIYDITPLQIL